MCPQPVFVPAAEPDAPGVKFAKLLNDKYRKEAGLPNIQYMCGDPDEGQYAGRRPESPDRHHETG